MEIIKAVFLEKLNQNTKIEIGDYWKVGFNSKVKINNIPFSFNYIEDSKLGVEMEVHNYEGDFPEFESSIVEAYLSSVQPKPEDIDPLVEIEICYENNGYGIEIIF